MPNSTVKCNNCNDNKQLTKDKIVIKQSKKHNLCCHKSLDIPVQINIMSKQCPKEK